MEEVLKGKLLFPQQFVLGPRFAGYFEGWKKHEITRSLRITAHPDLKIHDYSHGSRSLTLLGNILDPNNPDRENHEIIKELLVLHQDVRELIRATFDFCGNWILIYQQNEDIYIFHDCIGARALFYTDMNKVSELWFGSQPRLLGYLLDLKEDETAREFILAQQQKTVDYWWPGNSTPYAEIKALIPNWYFDVRRKRICRYWPERNLTKLESKEAIEKVSSRLGRIMTAAAQRFDLALALSAGWDSRLMLAASKPIKEKICVYNGKRPNLPFNHPDVVIPRSLTKQLRMEYHFIPQSEVIDEDFIKVYEANAPYPVMELAPGIQAELQYFQRQKVGMTGNVLETARFFYRGSSFVQCKPTGESLASLTKMQASPFAVKAFEEWINNARELYNINIYDLFYWEQRCGRWLANNCLVFHMAWKEVFFPFNCRNLLSDLLAVSEKDRTPPKYLFFQGLISTMWPDVLSEPINPHLQRSLVDKIVGKLKRISGLK